jgi:hypothetical protein
MGSAKKTVKRLECAPMQAKTDQIEVIVVVGDFGCLWQASCVVYSPITSQITL